MVKGWSTLNREESAGALSDKLQEMTVFSGRQKLASAMKLRRW